jgi:hypothetical protein
MKTIFGIISMIFLLSIEASSQTYTYRKFPTSADKPIWAESYALLPHQPLNWHYNLWGMIGDTVIGKNIYSKLYSLHDTILNTSSINYFFAGIREDQNKHVFIIYDGDSIEKLLFDFSKKTGDTVIYNNKYYDYFYSTWIELDTVFIEHETIKYCSNDSQYRELIMRYGGSQIESIGHNLGVFIPSYSITDDDLIYLTCFKINNNMVIGEYNCLQTFNSIKSDMQKHIVDLYYSNSKNAIIVDCRKIIGDLYLSIFDLAGKVVKNVRLSPNTINTISVCDLIDGVYMYNIISTFNGNHFSGKFIKN